VGPAGRQTWRARRPGGAAAPAVRRP